MRKLILMVLSIMICILLGMSQRGYSKVILIDRTFSTNNHEYRIISSTDISWNNANNNATSDGWYLATITNQQEQDFIKSLLTSISSSCSHCCGSTCGFWLGGFNATGFWQWVTGEPWSYTNWGNRQPRNGGKYLAISAKNVSCGGCCGGGHLRIGDWYTPIRCGGCGCSCCCGICGYIEEKSNTVPEPMTIFLIGSGMIGIFGYIVRNAIGAINPIKPLGRRA